jgi:hypothetical protein
VRLTRVVELCRVLVVGDLLLLLLRLLLLLMMMMMMMQLRVGHAGRRAARRQ